ncbi:MAG: glycosyltransferase family 2 protein, partial [Candidatus Micrarchaeaceae archaeon]
GQYMQAKKPYVSIVIPTLNEARNIGRVIKDIKQALDGYSYEIIVVDKHSKDNTAGIARRLGARIIYDDVGKGSALVKGIKESKGSVIISMDADLSHRANELKLLITAIEAGHDIAMGSRFIIGGGTEDMPLIRKLGNKFFVGLVNALFHANYTDMCYGYRSFRRGVMQKLDLKEPGFGIETEISIKAIKKGLNIIEIPSFEKRRAHGNGNLRTFRDGYIILKTILKNLRS